mmetsp:Transcript_8309/g.15713  ORF Transcript_8309/g.15713 Transcript_8309/m.15713 type:complete len:150 (+) Transcript_8309:237-686(+)|eukprot:CAMPEP_0114298012 /NCGR_PEP_ID=MMETSP0059-20121206/12186_1 /TAXON_ID=36894 /ORGANISM="Pyramimonas parkeae, Strain CCMP726" /LENGTH=149 /DNA_ID=CAMNT_0001420335 /DNA_START=237 /DNA_END=686 /DNA_ORIENTATION=-
MSNVTLAGYKSNKSRQGITGDNMRDPCPGYRFDIITGEKIPVYTRPADYKTGASDHAVNMPLSVSGLGVSEPRSLTKLSPSITSAKIMREDLRGHVRTKYEPQQRFQMPATSAMELGFKPAQPKPPAFGRKACQETIIEEYQIMGPRMP